MSTARRTAPAAVTRARAAVAALAADAGGLPLYRQAKRELLAAVEAGRFAPGQALPNESALASALGVSIGTLRHAVDELAAEHIVVRRQGRGTFVAMHGSDRFLFQFFHVERGDGLRELPEVEPIAFERGRCGEAAAQALGMREGDAVIEIVNGLRLQGRTVVLDRLTLPATVFKGLTERRLRDRPGTIYQFYQSEFGITVVRAVERARAIAADRGAARILGLAPGAPVMQISRTALSFGDKPVEFRVSIVNTAQHDYVHRLSRPGAPA